MHRQQRGLTALGAFVTATIIACQASETAAPRGVGGLAAGASGTIGANKGQEAQCDTILITSPTVNIAVGSTVQFTANAYNKNDKLLSKATATWSTSNVSVAAVSSAGLVTGVSAGSAIIHAACSATSGVGDRQVIVH